MRVGSLELFVDGRLVARFRAGQAPQLDTTKLPDGYHELRIVAVNADAIESRGRLILPIVVNNRGGKVEFSASPRTGVAATDKVQIIGPPAGGDVDRRPAESARGGPHPGRSGRGRSAGSDAWPGARRFAGGEPGSKSGDLAAAPARNQLIGR